MSHRKISTTGILFVFLASLTVTTTAYQQGIPQQALPKITNQHQQPKKNPSKKIVKPPNEPIYPNGPCGGSIITIPPSELFPASIADPINNIILPPRPIQIWLPPDYHSPTSSTKKYPVLYCHDGQNAVSDANSWTGHSFRLTGALVRLHRQKKISQIPVVVLLPSSDGDFVLPFVRRRHLEYGDAAVGSFSRAHADFVAKRVKPFVDAKFRTMTREDGGGGSSRCCFAMGTSLGGQASMTLLLRHGDLFDGAACLSPCFQPWTIAHAMSLGGHKLKDKRIYLDNGGDFEDVKVPLLVWQDHFTERHWWNPGYFWLDTHLQPGIDAMKTVLDMNGVDYEYNRIPGGRHNEREWARRIDLPLIRFFGS